MATIAIKSSIPIQGDFDVIDPTKRPKIFKSTIQECLFVFTTSMALGTSTFWAGTSIVITAPIARSLNVASTEVTWIGASFAYVVVFRKLSHLLIREQSYLWILAGPLWESG
jgi:hypothetical protein